MAKYTWSAPTNQYNVIGNAAAANSAVSSNIGIANVNSFVPYFATFFGGPTYGNISSLKAGNTFTFNGNALVLGSGNSNVKINTDGTISAVGNITANVFVGNGAGLTGVIAAGANIAGNLQGNLLANGFFVNNLTELVVSGNITGDYIYGNGAFLTGLPAGYANANVAAYLPTYTGLITASDVSATANITGAYYFGNGVYLTGMYGNSNVAEYLPVYTGDINANNVVIQGNLQVNGTTTTVNANTLSVANLVITVGSNQSTPSVLDGAGLVVGNNSLATWLYDYPTNSWQTNIDATPASNAVLNLGGGLNYWNNVYAVNGVYAGNASAVDFQYPNGVSVITTLNNSIANTNSNVANLTADTANSFSNVNSNIANTNSNVANLTSATANSFANVNSNVANLANSITSLSGAVYTDANVAAYLPTYLPTYNGNLLVTNLVGGTVSVTGNITGNYFIGNGSLLTGGYGDSNVGTYMPTYLPTYNGNLLVDVLTGTTASISGNIEASYFIGNGSQLTGLPVGYSNTNAQSFIETYTGNIAAGNISVVGNIQSNYLLGNGAFLTGLPASYSNANVANYLPTYSGDITARYVSTSGTIQTSAEISATGNIITDGYFVGNFVGNVSGNIVVPGLNKQVLFNNSGNAGASANLVFDYDTSILSVIGLVTATGNVGGNYIHGNGAFLTGLPATYGNTDVANYLANGSDPTIVSIVGNIANVAANVTSLTGSLANTNSNVTNVASNVTSVTGSLANTDSNVANTNSNVANVGNSVTSLTGSLAVTNSVVANNASNIAILQGNITSLTGDVYSNANVASYLPLYSGNITAGNIIVTANLQVQGTTTTVNVADVNVDNLVITVGSNQTTPSVLNGGGLAVGNNSVATWFYNYATDSWQSNISILPSVNLAANIGGPLNVWNNIYGRTVLATTVSATGNITSQYILGNGSQLTGLNTNFIANGTSNVTVAAGDANVTIGVSGAGNVVVVSPSALSVNGNVNGGNVNLSGYVSADRGLKAVSAYPGEFIDGVVVDYVDGNARFSTGANDGFEFFSHGVGNLLLLDINESGDLSALGNIQGTYVLGNGAYLTGLPAGYSNANVASYLPTYTGNISGGNISASGNIATNGFFIGDGSQLTGLPAGYANANVAAYLPTYTGDLTAGVISTTGTIKTANSITATGNISTAGFFVGNFVGNISGNLTVPGLTSQVLFNNEGNAGASPFFLFDSGNTLLTLLGEQTVTGNVTASSFFSANVSATSNVTGANIVGSAFTYPNGVSIINTYGNSNVANYLANGSDPTLANITSNVSNNSSNITVLQGNVVNLTSSLSNTNSNVTNVAANVTSLTGALANTNSNVANIEVSIASLTGNAYGNANVASYLPTYSGNLTAGNAVISGNLQVLGNTVTVNATTLSVANLTIGVGTTTNVPSALNGAGLLVGNTAVGNTAVASWLYNNTANAWQSNIGIVPTTANVTNLGSSSLPWGNVYSNIVIANTVQYPNGVPFSSYANSNVANYLPIYSGNMTALGNISISGNVDLGGNINAAGSGHYSFSTTGSAAVLNITGRDFQGTDWTWAFVTKPGIGVTPGFQWMAFPDGTNQVTAYPGIGNNLSLSGTITANSGFYTNSLVTATGNIQGNVFIGNGAGLTNVSVSIISNTTSNISIANAAGNITVAVSGVANVVTFTPQALTIGGNLQVAGQALKQVSSSAAATTAGTKTFYTAANTNINGTKLVVRAQVGSPMTSVQMMEIMATKDAANNVAWVTYSRVNSNVSVPNIAITMAINSSNVLIANAVIASNTYITYDATEFTTT